MTKEDFQRGVQDSVKYDGDKIRCTRQTGREVAEYDPIASRILFELADLHQDLVDHFRVKLERA